MCSILRLIKEWFLKPKTYNQYGVTSSLMLGQLIASGFLTTTVSYLTRLGHSTLWISCIKILVDFGLFLISYQIQKKFVFKEDKELEEVNAA